MLPLFGVGIIAEHGSVEHSVDLIVKATSQSAASCYLCFGVLSTGMI